MPVPKSIEEVALGTPQNLKLLLEKDEVSAANYLVSLNSNDFTILHCVCYVGIFTIH